MRHLWKVSDDLSGGPLLVRLWVRGVPVLERHEVAVVLRERAGDLDRSVRPFRAVRIDDLRPNSRSSPIRSSLALSGITTVSS